MAKPKCTPLGTMNKRMTIYSLDETPTDSGGTDDTPTALMTIRAAIVPLSGKERFLEGGQFRMVTHRITLNYRSGITAKMKGIYDDRTFEFIEVINVEEANRELQIIAIETAA